jgi:hypothetical protein
VTVAIGVIGFALLAGSLWPRPGAAAAVGPCGTTHDAIDTEESSFLALLQQWRDGHLSYSSDLEISGALSAAAAWHAQDLVTRSGSTLGGHYDSTGRYFTTRARDCGYPDPFASGGIGEGVYELGSSGGVNLGPQLAIQGITYQGSGVYIQTSSSSWPAKCVGVAVYRNANSTDVAWVVLIAQYPAGSACPAYNGTPPTPKTTSPTPSPTPTPTPLAHYGYTLTLAADAWTLVTLPPGPIEDVLARARGCYVAVYQQQGDAWLRFSPDVPAYARNLTYSNGGAFWIKGSGQSCGPVAL